jgi:hypothetical protein
MDVPKLSSEYRVGFRDFIASWQVVYDPEEKYAVEAEETPLLRARNRAVWSLTGPTRAVCFPHATQTVAGTWEPDPCEHAPTKNCSCGLYANHLPSRPSAFGIATGSANQVYGAVLGWGKRFRHGEEGFRAEYMLPVAFWIAPKWTAHRPVSSHVECIVAIADALDAKIFSRVEDMARYAFTLGSTWHPFGQSAVDEYYAKRRWSRGVHDDVREGEG